MASAKVIPVIESIRAYAADVRRLLVLELVDVLRLTTPVDTGHAKSNWIPRLGRPFRGVAGSREKVSYALQERGIREVMDEPAKSRRVANISNSVRYLRYLNQGSSQQAPSGFIQAAIAQAKVNARLKLGRLKRARR